jgi:CRP-like cAMP-binding protein
VKLGVSAPDGREAALGVLGSGDVFGVLSMFGAGSRSADATALVKSRALSLAHEEFRPYLERSPPVALELANLIARRAKQARDVAAGAMFGDVTSRLLDRLRDLAKRFGIPLDGGWLVDLPLAQQDLAGLVGASRESVNKALGSLAREGRIRCQDRRYVVVAAHG